jgi:DNA-binding NarL/FixJ family response regulator
MKLFIVEDSSSWRMYEHIQNMLPDINGIEVIGHAQHDELDVTERINALSPDVMIINVSRQTEAIICFMKSIKERHASIKIMALSNYTDECYVDHCMRTGANYFFDKVFFNESSKYMRDRAFMRIRAALWHLVNPGVLHDRFVTL